MKELLPLWYAKGDDCPYRIWVYETTQQRPHGLTPVKVYRSRDSGLTYSARYVKPWEELTVRQKDAAYRQAYRDAIDDARWRLMKDPGLKPQFPAWREQCRAERDAALARLMAGDEVPPPRALWE